MRVHILPPTYEAIEVTDENLAEVRGKVRPALGTKSGEPPTTVVGEPVAVGDFAVEMSGGTGDPIYVAYPPEFIQVVD